jgi:hypothetical protein
VPLRGECCGRDPATRCNGLGIADRLHRLFDPFDGSPRELEDEAATFTRGEIGEGIECRVDLRSPAGGGAIIDEVSGARRAVYRFAKARLEFLVVLVKGCRSHIQLAEQDQVLLREIDDYCDKLVDALSFQVIANARKCAGALSLPIGRGISRERGRDYVLAEAPVLECGAGAFAANLRAAPCDNGAILLTAGDLRQDAPGPQCEDFYQSVAVILGPTREHLFSDGCAQCADVEARPVAGVHSGGVQIAPVTIDCNPSSYSHSILPTDRNAATYKRKFPAQGRIPGGCPSTFSPLALKEDSHSWNLIRS